MLAGATYYAIAQADKTSVQAQSEKPTEQGTTIKRRPSWTGEFEGWSQTAPEIEKALEEAVKKIGTPDSDANTP
jgi:hypothetical protein